MRETHPRSVLRITLPRWSDFGPYTCCFTGDIGVLHLHRVNGTVGDRPLRVQENFNRSCAHIPGRGIPLPKAQRGVRGHRPFHIPWNAQAHPPNRSYYGDPPVCDAGAAPVRVRRTNAIFARRGSDSLIGTQSSWPKFRQNSGIINYAAIGGHPPILCRSPKKPQ